MRTINLTYIIEDDEIASYLIRKLLEEHPRFDQVHFFKNGKLALQGIEKTLRPDGPPVDLIILDLTMSIMDGWEFLHELKSLKNQKQIPPVVVLTSSIDNHDIEKAKSNPYVVTYFSKPLDENKLNQIIDLI
jgi:CheY-like chemotaxis protein